MYVFFIILNTNLIINPNKHLFHRKCEDEKKKKKKKWFHFQQSNTYIKSILKTKQW